MSRQRPRLRNGVDLQLQSAFQDGNWLVATRLAQQRARTSGDQYFDIVKVCAESQHDDPNLKLAAVAAVEQFVQDGVVVKDVDAIDLLEWATADLISEKPFSQTLGPLRVGAAKAAPKDKTVGTRCLQSCLLHWDLISAQQIAAILDRSFPQERDFMFWNISITHLLATSDQAPPDKKKLYGMLAQKQIERAAQVTEQAHTTASTDGVPARGVQTEEEMMLLYDIVVTHGTPEDLMKLICSPALSPLAQFQRGRKELLQQAMAIFVQRQMWEPLCELCQKCLCETDEAGELSFLACDWWVWKQYVNAASHLKGSNTDVVANLQKVLLQLAGSKNLKPLYRRNVLLARLAAVFELQTHEEDDVEGGEPVSLRLRELLHYMNDQMLSLSCFDDVKEFLEQLDAGGLEYVSCRYIADLRRKVDGDSQAARLNLFSLKMRYLLSSCVSSLTAFDRETVSSQFAASVDASASGAHEALMRKISVDALDAYKSARNQVANEATGTNTDILVDLAILIALCNVQLACPSRPAMSPCEPAATRHLLKAIFILEQQALLTPKDSQTSLLLVKLHLLLGSGNRSREIWKSLAVKRTIVDSLAPIFYDRLSTIAPVILDSAQSTGRQLVETLRWHYNHSLQTRMPRKLIDAFEAGSYASVLQIPKYIGNLRAGCTRSMSLVEEARAGRMLGEAQSGLLNDARFSDVSDGVILRSVVDHGSFPSWDPSSSPTIHERLSLGPAISDTRMHLSLLAEAFHDVLTYKAPTAYKATVADHAFVTESMAQLSNSLSRYLCNAAEHCTASEVMYFECLHLLATITSLGLSMTTRCSPVPGALDELIKAVDVSISQQLSDLPLLNGNIDGTVALLRSLHQLALFRDTAIAAKIASAWMLSLNEREKDRGRSGGSNSNSLPKAVVVHLTTLQASAEAALKQGKAIVTKLKGEVATGQCSMKLRDWVFEDENDGDVSDVIENAVVEDLVHSWKQNVAGWERVRWE